ncbi:hypothetical protein [Halomonas koreensis]|uniref:Uncharacterized protein n=1 Tax=Halomonas koreensis TaxID=245385 RepID=A0ABU1G0U4_9GAMM|nr:hypothetical protein [Halomonas koreensis]MDR5866552.1 hypothetical protein [Halomonas koreensis]
MKTYQCARCGIRRRATSLLVGMALLASSSAMAVSHITPEPPGILSGGTHDIYYRGHVIADAGLEELRGGFSLGGMELNFGARLTTMINDRLRYETRVAFTRAGTEVLSRQLTDLQPSGPAAALVGPGQSLGAASINGAGLDLSGLADFSGVVANGRGGGMIAALHRVTRDAIVSTLATNANGQVVDNTIDISVHINNIGSLRAARQRDRIVNSLIGLPR